MRMPRSVKCGKASLVFIAAVTLAGCTLTATGTGTVTITRHGRVIKRWTIAAGRSSRVAMFLPFNLKGAKITVTRAGKRVAFTALA